jgi:transposase
MAPNSPDLNPIGRLWEAIKRRVQWDSIQTREEAIRTIQTVWSEFQQGSIDGLVASFFNRMQMVRDAKGRTI